MIDFKKFAAALNQCESAAKSGALTTKAMENAMVNLDRMAPSFGPSSHEFRRVADVNTFDPVTSEEFAAYIAGKQAMLANNAYLIG